MDLSFGKHLVETCQGLGSTGKDNQSADWTIQSVDYSQEDFSRFLVTLLDIRLYRIRKGDIARLVALDDLPALLIDYDNMVVLVNDLHTSYILLLTSDILHQTSYIFMPPSTWITCPET